MKAYVVLPLGLISLAMSSGASAQPLPTPYDFVSNLDLECYRSTPEPPPASSVNLRHLNPALGGLQQMANLFELRRVCLPVQKNGRTPPPQVRPFVSEVDLACYRAEAPPVDIPIRVSHLNPVLGNLPDETLRITELKQVCLPVEKTAANGNPGQPSQTPFNVRQLVQHIDVACYKLQQSTSDVNFPLTLEHLNPVVRGYNLPGRNTRMRRAFQLCLPVGKDNQPIPPAVRQIVRWVDFLRYRLNPVPAVSMDLWLEHRNPLYVGAAPFFESLFTPPNLHLMVPVSKRTPGPNGGVFIPPQD
ncbi:MAG: hypothetical protein AAFZ18_13430 [Myxococcota bacterium]